MKTFIISSESELRNFVTNLEDEEKTLSASEEVA